MRIYSMTATFGKLEHETLTLRPGLNVIYAPNEWGKSTWCAFLLAMLYGMDTRAKTTKNAIADKERFAPWSGSPMEGRIDLCWQGRDITIERRTAGRIPLGAFRAYETETGLEVPELTAANCGQQLLGVEQSIFRRSGFIRLTDLPVTQDEALRARLNALVTTGEEGDDAIRLAESLRELKNRCRYNRTGLLPQAMAQREMLETKLDELTSLELQSRKLRERQGEEDTWLRQLQNHRAALIYAESREDARRVAEARDMRDQQVRRMEAAEAACANLPSRQEAEDKAAALRELLQKQSGLTTSLRVMPDPPAMPEAPAVFRGMTPEEAAERVEDDTRKFRRTRSHFWLIWLFLTVLWAATAGAIFLLTEERYLSAIAGGVAVICLIRGILVKVRQNRQAADICRAYGLEDPAGWKDLAESFAAAARIYEQNNQAYLLARASVEMRSTALERQREALCGSRQPEDMLELWQQVTARWNEYEDARRDTDQAEKHLTNLLAMAKPDCTPAGEDHLVYSPQETEQLIRESEAQYQRLQGRLNQYRGRMDALGDSAELRRQLEQVQTRIGKLEDTYAALTIAQETLAAATMELQRRFAPKITRRAQEILNALTGGRYDRLVISEDFSLRAAAQLEDTLHDAIWRSDGTVDQLYLALRLAVSEALTPETPLILDDALVRFDEERMSAALALLQEMAGERQIILFSCQEREQKRMAAETVEE